MSKHLEEVRDWHETLARKETAFDADMDSLARAEELWMAMQGTNDIRSGRNLIRVFGPSACISDDAARRLCIEAYELWRVSGEVLKSKAIQLAAQERINGLVGEEAVDWVRAIVQVVKET